MRTMRTVLWDMDGTIADSERAHFHAWQVSLEKYGVTYSFADFMAGFGRSNASLIPELMGVEPGSEIGVASVAREGSELPSTGRDERGWSHCRV